MLKLYLGRPAILLLLLSVGFAHAGERVFLVRPFVVDRQSELCTRVSVTVQRKLIEVLARRGAHVLSPLTNTAPTTGPEFVFEGSVQQHKDTVKAVVGLVTPKGAKIAQTSICGDNLFFAAARNVLGETVLYGLGIHHTSLERSGRLIRPTESTEAYALYRAAQLEYRARNTDKAIGLLEQSYLLDSAFALAAWAVAGLYRTKQDAAMADLWLGMAILADPSHPRWEFDEPEARRELVPELLRSSLRSDADTSEPGIATKAFTVRKFGVSVMVWVVDPRKREISLVLQRQTTGDHVGDFAKHADATLAVNGGFFEMDNNFQLTPSGLVVVHGREEAPLTNRGGSGVFHVTDGKPGISWRQDIKKDKAFDMAVQCGPVIVEPGGKLGVYSNDFKRVGRTAVGLREGRVVFVVVGEHEGKGVSLYELAMYLQTALSHGGLGCDVALNLDGGLSSQAYYKAGDTVREIPGLWAVHNALVVK